MNIVKFNVDKLKKLLIIDFYQNDEQLKRAELSFEYLRISAPQEADKSGKTPVICHKKEVLIMNIESVAKHGYRFVFSDQHRAIYSADDIFTLIMEKDNRWNSYLSELKASGHSREAMIDFKQL